jgi:hypothetical protein
MPKKAPALVGVELAEAGGDRSLEVLEGAGGRLAHVALELGEGQLDRIEIGTIGGR